MEAILYVCHGTRVKKGNEQAKKFAQACMQVITSPIQEIAYLELTTPTISEGLLTCVKRGATRIIIVPLLLLTATHAKKDIPESTVFFEKEYSHIPIFFASPIGVHANMITILEEKIMEKTKVKDYKQKGTLLLVARGSNDADVKKDFSAITNMLRQRNENYKVIDCYLTGASPNIKELLLDASKLKQPIMIVPYLLFTGLLMRGLKEQVQQLYESGYDITLCDSLGIHPNIIEIIIHRIKEAYVVKKV